MGRIVFVLALFVGLFLGVGCRSASLADVDSIETEMQKLERDIAVNRAIVDAFDNSVLSADTAEIPVEDNSSGVVSNNVISKTVSAVVGVLFLVGFGLWVVREHFRNVKKGVKNKRGRKG